MGQHDKSSMNINPAPVRVAPGNESLPQVRERVEAKYHAMRLQHGMHYQNIDRRYAATLREASGWPPLEQIQAWLRFETWLQEFEQRSDDAALRLAEDQRASMAARPGGAFDPTCFVLQLRQRGIMIHSPGAGRIIVNPRAGLNSVDEAMLRQHRDAILKVLNDWVER